MPRSRTAAGSPRAARSVPGGVSRRKAGTPSSTPATTSGKPGIGRASVRPATIIAGAGREHQGKRQPAPRCRFGSRPRRRPRARPARPPRSPAAVMSAAIRDERQQAEEHEPPVERVGDEPGERRPDARRAGPTPSTASRTSAAAGASGSARPIDDVGDRRDRPGAEALDDPCGDEDLHRRRQAADEQPDREQAQAQDERRERGSPDRSARRRRRSR